MDGRTQWLQHVVTKGLGATPRAFEYMIKTQDGAKKLMEAFLENEDGQTPTLCFYASVMELSLARMVHGGKLTGDADEPEPEPEPPAPPPPPEPEPADITDGEAAAAPAAEGGEAAAEGAPAAAEPAAEGEAAAPPAADGETPAAEAGAPAAEGEAAAPAAEGEEAAETAAEEPAPPPPPKPEEPKRYQDPAELLMVYMCTPGELTPQACVARLVYFNLKTEELGALGTKGGNSASNTEGMSSSAADAAGGMETALDYGIVAGGSMIMLEQVIHEIYVPLVQNSAANIIKVRRHIANNARAPPPPHCAPPSPLPPPEFPCARSLLLAERAAGHRDDRRLDGVCEQHAKVWLTAHPRHPADDGRRAADDSAADD